MFNIPTIMFASSTSPISKLDDIIDQTLRLVAVGKNAEAEKLMLQFDKEFKSYSNANKQLSENEFLIISKAQQESIEVFKNSAESKELHNKVTSLRLAVDALEDNGKPLWLEMKEPINITIKNIEKAIDNKDYDQYNFYFNLLLTQYQKIVPAMKLDVEKSTFQSIDQKIQGIEASRRQIFLDDSSHSQIIELKTELNGVFQTVLIESTEPSLIWVISTTGGIILITLSYVGWRKYAAEKKEADKRTKKIS
ncbi:MAG: sporulation protein YpjB [Bacillales bacterium]|jgi:sporulation protein YpjB|nr:sporulation protein YpjB [Bacillales bacterium]